MNIDFYGEINGKEFTNPESFIEEYKKTKSMNILNNFSFNEEEVFIALSRFEEKLKNFLEQKIDIFKIKSEFNEETTKKLVEIDKELDAYISLYDDMKNKCLTCKEAILDICNDDTEVSVEDNNQKNEPKQCYGCCSKEKEGCLCCDDNAEVSVEDNNQKNETKQCHGCCSKEKEYLCYDGDTLVNEVIELIRTYFSN